MGWYHKRNNKAAKSTVPEAATMRTIIATILAVISAIVLINFVDNKPIVGVQEDQATTVEHYSPVVVDTVKNEVQPQDTPKEELIPEPLPAATCDSEIAKYDGWDRSIAYAVMMAESGNNPTNIGDITLQYTVDGVTYGASYGCFQIRYLPGRPESNLLLNPVFNVKYAYDMYLGQGWKPWSAYKTGAYARYIQL